MSSIGPDLPPHLLAKRKRQAEESSAPKEDSKNAAPPPSSPNSDKRRRIAGPSLGPSQADTSDQPPKQSKPVLGPSLPPAPLEEKPSAPTSYADSDSDSDYGPSLPSAAGRVSTTTQANADLLPDDSALSASTQDGNSKPARAGWMTVPPSADGLRSLDPSQQRARGFNTHRTAGAQTGGVADTWTETPEEKRQRLANAVLGIAPAAESDKNAAAKKKQDEKNRREMEETRRRVQEHAERHRGESLMNQHQRGKGAEEEDDPSKRGFDWEKDMNSSAAVSGKAKREMMDRAANFGSRFSGGGYL